MLYKYFMDGENSGKMMSPEEVHILLHQDLTADEYVTSQQIRSLYSNWSKKLREGNICADDDLSVSK